MTQAVTLHSTQGEQQELRSLERQRLRRACEDFSSFVTLYLMKSMREAVPRAEEPDNARLVYESMLDQAIAQTCTRHHALGLSELLYHALEPLVDTKDHAGETTSPTLKNPAALKTTM